MKNKLAYLRDRVSYSAIRKPYRNVSDFISLYLLYTTLKSAKWMFKLSEFSNCKNSKKWRMLPHLYILGHCTFLFSATGQSDLRL